MGVLAAEFLVICGLRPGEDAGLATLAAERGHADAVRVLPPVEFARLPAIYQWKEQA